MSGFTSLKLEYGRIFGDAWPAWIGGLLVGILNVFEYIYEKPWGITSATSRWSGWILTVFGIDTPAWLYFQQMKMVEKIPFTYGGDAINIGVILGAFIASCLSYEFSIRKARSKGMYLQAFIGGVFMGYGARLCSGCNLGGFLCSIPSLSLSGWIFWIGMAIGAYLGIKIIVKMAMRRNEIKVRSPQPGRNGKRQLFLGIIGIFIAIGITLLYLHSDSDVAIFFLFGIGFGVIIQRSRFCFVTCYKDLFVTRDVSLFKAIVIAMLVSTIGFSLIMYHMVPDPSSGELPPHAKINNIGPFGIPHLIGGILFGLGMVLAGGCASGTLYRMGEGYLILWVAFFGTLVGYTLLAYSWEWLYPDLLEGTKIWLPQYLGWGWSVFLTIAILVVVYLGISYWEVAGWD
ncbi:MAG: YeeE/YedE thiosulfate transporter family protein [Candidatus Syntropharchaeia archaeon]